MRGYDRTTWTSTRCPMEGTMSDRASVLPPADPSALGLDPGQIDRLYALIARHIEEGRYPGAQVAIARRGKLVAFRTFGNARTEPQPVPATDDTLWLLYSQTKVVVAAAIWQLVDRGVLGFGDRISEHIPEFSRN